VIPNLVSGSEVFAVFAPLLSGRDIRLRHADGVPAVLRKRTVGTTGLLPPQTAFTRQLLNE
jgi:hypothetical protein